MSLLIPFDFNPVNIDERTGDTSYTVPAGKYAIVTVTMRAHAAVHLIASVSTSATITGDTQNVADSQSLEIRLSSGAVLDATHSSSNVSTATSTAGTCVSESSSSVVSVTVDAVEIAALSVQADGWNHCTGTGTRTLYGTGSADCRWQIAEYNNVT